MPGRNRLLGAASGAGTAILLALIACGGETQSLKVTATAFNSTPAQTDGRPRLAAWGDSIRPGMKVVAVSLDLLELGLDRHSTIRIQGLGGEYVVLDRMPSHWKRRIDVYMGEDVEAARRWGKRRVTIRWRGAGK